MLRRLFEREAGPEVEIPTGGPLTDAELQAGLLREVDLISQTLPMTTCRIGEIVTSPDDDAERLYIVKHGRVRLYRLTPDGKQLTLDILDKGRIVAYVPLRPACLRRIGPQFCAQAPSVSWS